MIKRKVNSRSVSSKRNEAKFWYGRSHHLCIDHFQGLRIIFGQFQPLPQRIWSVRTLDGFHVQIQNPCNRIPAEHTTLSCHLTVDWDGVSAAPMPAEPVSCCSTSECYRLFRSTLCGRLRILRAWHVHQDSQLMC